MRTRPYDFSNRRGETLPARLEEPDGPARAWAVFAHCFGCGMDSLAAVRVSRALAARRIGVLRFDFGGVEGPEATRFGGQVEDVVDAAAHLRGRDRAPARWSATASAGRRCWRLRRRSPRRRRQRRSARPSTRST